MKSLNEVPRLDGLQKIADGYDLILCDVWGVLHNGIQPFEDTVHALSSFRQEGGHVVMVTNAPRRRKSVFTQLAEMGVPQTVFDTIVTSGDVTRKLIAQGPSKVFHIGPKKDLNLFEEIDVTLVDEASAEIVVCSGLWDDATETPDDYTQLLQRLADRKLDMICANPDIVVEIGSRMAYCAGALASAYQQIGAKSLIAGKPHKPIYDVAIQEAEAIMQTEIDRKRILAIGDGMPTDIKGAANYGLDVLYISAGIHACEYGDTLNPDHGAVQSFLHSHGREPVSYMPRLAW